MEDLSQSAGVTRGLALLGGASLSFKSRSKKDAGMNWMRYSEQGGFIIDMQRKKKEVRPASIQRRIEEGNLFSYASVY